MAEDRFEDSLVGALQNAYNNALSIVRDIFALFTLEVKLAGKSLGIIIILLAVASLFLLATWFSLLGVLAAWLLSLKLTIIQALGIVSAINLFLIIVIAFYIARISKNLKLKETRTQLAGLTHETTTP